MLLRWLKRRRRRRIAAEPMPPEWNAILDAIPHVPILAGAHREQLADAVKIFVAEKQFFGAKDLEITDAMRVTVAGLASLMTLGMPEFFFDHVSSIILHGSIIRAPKKVAIGTAAMLEDEIEELGDATLHGPVRLVWPQIEEDLREPWGGHNLVFHEFAHQLDMMNGSADGVPILPRDLRKPWQAIMLAEFDKLMRATRRRRRTLIDPPGRPPGQKSSSPSPARRSSTRRSTCGSSIRIFTRSSSATMGKTRPSASTSGNAGRSCKLPACELHRARTSRRRRGYLEALQAGSSLRLRRDSHEIANRILDRARRNDRHPRRPDDAPRLPPTPWDGKESRIADYGQGRTKLTPDALARSRRRRPLLGVLIRPHVRARKSAGRAADEGRGSRREAT